MPYQGYDPSVPTVDERNNHIVFMIGELGSAIENAEKVVSELEKRLEPVIPTGAGRLGPPEMVEKELGTAISSHSFVYNGLSDFNNKVRKLTRNLESIMVRLDLP